LKKEDYKLVNIFFIEMKNIGFYVVDNINLKKLSCVLPDFYYYKTQYTVTVSSKLDIYESYIPHLSLFDDKGDVNLYYICLNVRKYTPQAQSNIFDSLINVFQPCMKSQEMFYLFLETVKMCMMDNVKYVIQYANKLHKLGMKFYKNDILSYISDYHTSEFITSYNTEIFRFCSNYNNRQCVWSFDIIASYQFIYDHDNVILHEHDHKFPRFHTVMVDITYKNKLYDNLMHYIKTNKWDISYGLLLIEYKNIQSAYGPPKLSQLKLIILTFINMIVCPPCCDATKKNMSDINLFNIMPVFKLNSGFMTYKSQYVLATYKLIMFLIKDYQKISNAITLCPCQSNIISNDMCVKLFDCIHDPINYNITVPFTSQIEYNDSDSESCEDDSYDRIYYDDYQTFR